jgi:hypothetical protein
VQRNAWAATKKEIKMFDIDDADGKRISVFGLVELSWGAKLIARHVAINYWLLRRSGGNWMRIYNPFSLRYCH